MTGKSDKRDYRVKIEVPSNSKAGMRGMDVDPGREIKTIKDPETAKQDAEFAEAMEADMDRYTRDTERGRAADEDWKNRARFDGNKNLETSNDLTFVDKMYTPVVKRPENAEGGGNGSKGNEFGDDNTYFWNSNDNRSIKQNRQDRQNRDNNKKK